MNLYLLFSWWDVFLRGRGPCCFTSSKSSWSSSIMFIFSSFSSFFLHLMPLFCNPDFKFFNNFKSLSNNLQLERSSLKQMSTNNSTVEEDSGGFSRKFLGFGHFNLGAQSFTSLKAVLRQDIINRCFAFSWCLNRTFPWRKCSVKVLVS